jgi:putative hydrolase of the HAD superfamily
MESPIVNLRAVIFDVYGTLFEVGPAPADAAARWERLWHDRFAAEPRLTLPQFSAACDEIIARENALARSRGIPHPEVCWPAVAAEVLPELRACPSTERDEFLFQQACLWHTARLAAEAPATLRALRERGLLLGIASNAQAYTVRELQEVLAPHYLDLSLFKPDLCFWSFEHGFKKPDPHVFQILTARLAGRGIHPAETLMIGDLLDNDIVPAQACGWQTWLLDANASGQGGGWRALVSRLRL